MTVDIICPLYNARNYIMDLHQNIKKQKNVEVLSINYVVTKTNDNIEEILESLDCNYEMIEREEFSHSLTRERMANKCKADIIVFITQDVIIKSESWLKNLIRGIEENECEAAFSRQICTNSTIEKYTRERNYPDKSYVKTKEDISKMGINAFFFSDASSAVKREIFVELNGYDGKNFPTNEDMYLAYKLLTNGYRIKYCADSEVEHSHKFTFKQLYKRYYDTGVFFKQNEYLNDYKINKTGGGMAKYVLKRAIQDKNFKVLIRFVPDMAARYMGMKIGRYRG